MTKIISCKSLGKRPVYDIGVVQDHNFVLANGAVASNCFNKSHSTAYAYITYQTAYLKANYPVEYMTALLTASSDNQDKVEKYRENSQKMGIHVNPPDINRSQKDFTPIGDNILFGLSAVKNLGEGTIDNILKARNKEGDFKSLSDFCCRVDLRVVNRRALETLIYCGAFDKVQANRNQLINDLDLIISWAQKRAKEKETGQLNIFDMLGNDIQNNANNQSKFEQEPSSPSIADFSLPKRLKLEKEHLGFYVSDHPLKLVKKAAQILSPVNLSELENQRYKSKVSAVVMVNEVKKIVTKTGKEMAFLTLEDISGQSEGVVFSDVYERIKELLIEDNHLIIWGKVDRRDDKVQLIIENGEVIENVKLLIVKLTLQQAVNKNSQQNLKRILQENSRDKTKAKIPVIAIISIGDQQKFIRFGQNYWVQNEFRAISSLENAEFLVYTSSLMSVAQ
ncbi:helix-hairpin-helix domain-containing protein [cyanobacterium endosymbiont of Epithemia clementina EcSB]|uniref:helix-hairpin-helix domain-containing protein n=1 Tax=cyanobacterium endosymbiont of Epithemia clementina EcSB TaxID=3034674 RepID=UPI002480644A|nr:OB-fold nucleic acid binding domain-containing protein [cyanobacterium endosymbiont of Epithemia clementina EcSB]WGT68255.1 OB-fold nucleic acid binding domain-containing protein [cyanobacterium endosymbiont of Epithemia clementina EcSB]